VCLWCDRALQKQQLWVQPTWQVWPQAFGPTQQKFPRNGLKTDALCRRLHLLNVKRDWPVGAKQLRDRALGRKIEV
jgi:hypothetical protein